MRKKFSLFVVFIFTLVVGIVGISNAKVKAAGDNTNAVVNEKKEFIPIHKYTFDNDDGNNVIDTGNSKILLNGNAKGSLLLDEGGNKFRRFDGKSKISFNSKIIDGKSKFTLKIRIRLNEDNCSSDHGFYVIDNSNTYDRGISIFLGDNNIGFRVNDFRSSAGINIKDNKWHDVMLTWDGTTNNNGVKFYLDNLKKPVKSGKVSTINGAIENLAFGDIGSWDSDRYKFKGDLDDIEIYDEVVDYSSKAESISLDKTSMDLIEGSSDKINAKVLPEDATNKKVVWSSSDEKIVKVDENGKVTAIKEGQVTITAKVEGTDLTATCKVNVTKKVEENKNNAILSISLVNGATKEYDVSMQEVEKFINWFEGRSNGKGPSLYSFNKKINPYKTVKEYIVHDKIASFEVREYEGTNK
ncbi:TPA: Ig-like domain-containing protein [Clostridium botulinum]|uniref:Ig-like domain-containing protein n=1 Tax=Clostridium botulinum TaxID=1491 RepID=UPI000D0E04F4|nr:Ig-like domain-containing protein [Clostridium botulinum]PSM00382.1 hypothetical protein C6C12_11630 [Clostridium botulinum]HDK7138919.1 Ig-like domain-containing protein [Clostridium botulinum]HDK7142248.1 Ig-like domain-containing protein [Clostridium botulinum]HDK7144142.1 Ig-like domain-containing protein [Clostridium botulinum]HDK7147794.1 Ig-like domain-containing protein [Clostridium botulinum]